MWVHQNLTKWVPIGFGSFLGRWFPCTRYLDHTSCQILQAVDSRHRLSLVQVLNWSMTSPKMKMSHGDWFRKMAGASFIAVTVNIDICMLWMCWPPKSPESSQLHCWNLLTFPLRTSIVNSISWLLWSGCLSSTPSVNELLVNASQFHQLIIVIRITEWNFLNHRSCLSSAPSVNECRRIGIVILSICGPKFIPCV